MTLHAKNIHLWWSNMIRVAEGNIS